MAPSFVFFEILTDGKDQCKVLAPPSHTTRPYPRPNETYDEYVWFLEIIAPLLLRLTSKITVMLTVVTPMTVHTRERRLPTCGGGIGDTIGDGEVALKEDETRRSRIVVRSGLIRSGGRREIRL
jgi:hypothetical protein